MVSLDVGLVLVVHGLFAGCVQAVYRLCLLPIYRQTFHDRATAWRHESHAVTKLAVICFVALGCLQPWAWHWYSPVQSCQTWTMKMYYFSPTSCTYLRHIFTVIYFIVYVFLICEIDICIYRIFWGIFLYPFMLVTLYATRALANLWCFKMRGVRL